MIEGGSAHCARRRSRQITLSTTDDALKALQQQVYAAEDAAKAADAAKTLAAAWGTVGESIDGEIARIRRLTEAGTGGSFAGLLSQSNAANSLARSTDPGAMDAAKTLPGLSKAVLDAAALAAISRQEPDRVQAQTAAALEATYGVLGQFSAEAAADPTLSANPLF